jgi:hypothetical protein
LGFGGVGGLGFGGVGVWQIIQDDTLNPGLAFGDEGSDQRARRDSQLGYTSLFR